MLDDEGPKTKNAMNQVLDDEREGLGMIALAHVGGKIKYDDLKSQFEDEKEALVAGLSMLRAISKAPFKKPVNTAVKAFWKYVLTASVRLDRSPSQALKPSVANYYVVDNHDKLR